MAKIRIQVCVSIANFQYLVTIKHAYIIKLKTPRDESAELGGKWEINLIR